MKKRKHQLKSSSVVKFREMRHYDIDTESYVFEVDGALHYFDGVEDYQYRDADPFIKRAYFEQEHDFGRQAAKIAYVVLFINCKKPEPKASVFLPYRYLQYPAWLISQLEFEYWLTSSRQELEAAIRLLADFKPGLQAQLEALLIAKELCP